MVSEQPPIRSGEPGGRATVESASFGGRLGSRDWHDVQQSFLTFAFTETVSITDPLDQRARINFVRHCGQVPEGFSDVAVTVKLSNGQDLATYRLTGILSSDVRERVQIILSWAQNKEISPLNAISALVKATRLSSNLVWTPERVLDRERGETVVPPMGYAIPTLSEYLANPDCVAENFFCAKHEGQNHVRLESHLSVTTGKAILDLSTTSATGRIEKHLFVINSAVDRRVHGEDGIRRDLMIQTYNAMEVFWDLGSDEVRQYLLRQTAEAAAEVGGHALDSDSELLTDSLISKAPLDVTSWDITHELPSGAVMQFAAGKHFALVTLSGNQGDSPAVYFWVFRDEQGDLSDPANPQRAEILNLTRQFAAHESDEVRLDAIRRLGALKVATPMPLAPSIEAILGPEVAFTLAEIPHLEISTVVPGDAEDIVRMARGIDTMRISLADRRLKNRAPQLLDQIDLDFWPNGDIEIIGVTRLGGRLTAFVSLESINQAGGREVFLQALAEAAASQSSSGIRVVQDILSKTVALDADTSWMSMSGDPYACDLPPTDDIIGQAMYTLGAILIKKYSEISRGSPEDCRLHYIGEGAVKVTLGIPSDPYQLNVVIRDQHVTRLEITPNLRVDESTYRADYENSRHYICDLRVRDSRADRGTLIEAFQLFDSLLTSADNSKSDPVILDFDRSKLRAFLDRRFGPPGLRQL